MQIVCWIYVLYKIFVQCVACLLILLIGCCRTIFFSSLFYSVPQLVEVCFMARKCIFFDVYLFWERVHAWAGEGQRKRRERISSRFHAQCRAGCRAQSHNCDIMTWAKSRIGHLTDWATRAPLVYLSMCSVSPWQEHALCYCYMFYTCQSDPVGWWCFSIPSVTSCLCVPSIVKKGMQLSNYNCEFIYLSSKFYQLMLHIFGNSVVWWTLI